MTNSNESIQTLFNLDLPELRPDEEQRKADVLSGMTVVANQKSDKGLIQWAKENKLAVYIGRGSVYGNPFVISKEATRDDVCNDYENKYLPFQPSIIAKLPELKGKVLLCYCYPERCHGDTLAALTSCPLRP